jgi:undecaprenyl-diphosphatase
MDQSLFFAINNLAGHSGFFDAIGKFIGGDYFLYLFVAAAALLWFRKPLRRYVYVGLVGAAIGYGVIAKLVKYLIDKPRPFEVLQVHKLIAEPASAAFPSGHATIYFAIAFAFWRTKYFWPLIVLAVLGSLGRVFVGVHYPLDILGGAVLGGLMAWIFRRLFKSRV